MSTPETTLVPGSLFTSDTLPPGSTGSVMHHPNFHFELPLTGAPFIQGPPFEDVFNYVVEDVCEPQILDAAELCDFHMDRIGLIFGGKLDIDIQIKETPHLSYVDPKAQAYNDHVSMVKLSDKIVDLEKQMKYDDEADKRRDEIIDKAKRRHRSFSAKISHFADISRKEHRRVRTSERRIDALNINVKSLQQKMAENSEAFEVELEAVRGELIEANEGRKYAEEQSEKAQKELTEAKEEMTRVIRVYAARLDTMTTERDDHREKCELLEVQLARVRQTIQSYHQSAIADRDRRSDEEEAAADGICFKLAKAKQGFFNTLKERIASFFRRD